jgi:hypothetical protein
MTSIDIDLNALLATGVQHNPDAEPEPTTTNVDTDDEDAGDPKLLAIRNAIISGQFTEVPVSDE